MYCIRSKVDLDYDGSSLYWNNQYGWVNSSELDLFTYTEMCTFNLPN